jgi:hypothetical protein
MMHIFESLPILAQSLKLRLQQLVKQYEKDEELLALVPFPTAGDYEPGHDQGRFGDAWLDLAVTAKADGELLLDRWLKFEKEGDGVFDLYCEIRQDIAKVAKRKDKLTKEKPAPKKAPTKKQSVPVATRDGYEPLRVSKDLPLTPHYPKAVRGVLASIIVKIQTVTRERASTKEQDARAEKLKAAKEKLVADVKAKQDAEAAAATAAAAAAATTANPAGVLCDLRSVLFFCILACFLIASVIFKPVVFNL